MQRRLLVVDSDPFNGEIMRRVFMSMCTVDIVKNTESLSAALKTPTPPQIVFCEIREDETDKLEHVFAATRNMYPEVLVIIAVEENSLELERTARVNKVFYYLVRPFNLKELWEAMECGFRHAEKIRMRASRI